MQGEGQERKEKRRGRKKGKGRGIETTRKENLVRRRTNERREGMTKIKRKRQI